MRRLAWEPGSVRQCKRVLLLEAHLGQELRSGEFKGPVLVLERGSGRLPTERAIGDYGILYITGTYFCILSKFIGASANMSSFVSALRL